VGGADDHGRGIRRHRHCPLARQTVGEEPLTGHGKSVKEIAEIVGIIEATVKTRMFYTRRSAPARHWQKSQRVIRIDKEAINTGA
jgi:hypothetical protein